MRIPHRELESFRRNPRAWLTRKQQAPPFEGRRLWNESALRMAVHWLHKNHTLDEAARKLRFYARKDPDLDGRRAALQRLAAYALWHNQSGRVTTHVQVRFPSWDDSSLTLGGSIDRMDFLAGAAQPIQAIFLGRHTVRWRDELRMPLAQHATAALLGWPPREVAVGVQLIDGSPPEIHHYPPNELADAVDELEHLRSQVADLA